MVEKIFILNHTHVDFGYTDSREKVIRDFVEMIDQAIDLVEASAGRPEPERFRWIHETSWPVLNYLRCRPGRKEALFDQIRQGRQELTALYVNPTDLFDYDSFKISTDYACDLARQHRLPLTTAEFGDCPGIAWSVPDLLGERGIKYLSLAPDFIMSFPLEVERPFYWEGPKGHRLLTWFSEWRNFWYAEGLFALKLHEDSVQATRLLTDYVHQIEGEGYRWKGLAIHVAMDNVGCCPALMDFVAHFNHVQSKREARMATNCDFLSYMEQHHGGEFEVHRAAWPDWWANGNGASAYETACSRQTKASLRRSSALARETGRTIDPGALRDIHEDLFMYDEHTFGHSTSVCSPWSNLARLQWSQKRTFAMNALDKARRLEMDLYKSKSPQPAAEPKPCSCPFTGLENDHFRINYDQATGAVIGIQDKINHLDLCDPGATWSFGEVIHEKVRDGSREAMYDIKLGANKPESKRPRPEFVRLAGHAGAREIKVTPGATFNALITCGQLPGVKFNRKIRLYHHEHRIDVVLRLDKQIDTDYESLYLAFPFAVKSPEVVVENAGAVYRAGIEQLPGSATDFHSVGEYLAVSDKSKTIIFVPHDVPVVQIGDIHTGKWQKKLEIGTGQIFSWIMNNMWFTNFPAYQEGKMEFTWSLTCHTGGFNPAEAEAFAWNTRVGTTDPEQMEKSIVW